MCYLRRSSQNNFLEQFADFTGTDRIYIRDKGAFQFATSAKDVKERKKDYANKVTPVCMN